MSKILPIENIEIRPNPHIVYLGSIYESDHSIYTKCLFFYDRYKKLVNFILFILLIGIIILISVSNFESSDNPCIDYSIEDLASTISQTCFRYMWSKTCKSSIPENFDGGWWLRSPKGGMMVPCRLENKGSNCGAGSFKVISTYLYKCELYYEGN